MLTIPARSPVPLPTTETGTVTRKRKGQHYNPANSPDNRRFRVQRSDGIVIARNLGRKEAEEVAEQLAGKNTSQSLHYRIKLDNSPVVNLQDYLKE